MIIQKSPKSFRLQYLWGFRAVDSWIQNQPQSLLTSNCFFLLVFFTYSHNAQNWGLSSLCCPGLFSWDVILDRFTHWTCDPSSLHLLGAETGDSPELGNSFQLLLATEKNINKGCVKLLWPDTNPTSQPDNAPIGGAFSGLCQCPAGEIMCSRSFPTLVDTLWFDCLSKICVSM